MNSVILRAELRDIKPPIWRRLLIPGATRLDGVHDVLQAVFGWNNSHLHQFNIGEKTFGRPDYDEDATNLLDERNESLLSVGGAGTTLVYEYDFGDGWTVDLVIEKELESALLLDGARCGPPDDCGGPFGYQEFVKAITDPRHKEHKAMRNWIGREFDPERLDFEFINASFSGRPKRTKSTRVSKRR